ncbi:MAG: hypothetical protein KUG82_22515 [Pseudomonadales bacterium]|nr:hypothetical protein [Pseudomonadales bacterium]
MSYKTTVSYQPTKREKWIVLITCVVVMLSVWISQILDPLQVQRDEMLKQIKRQNELVVNAETDLEKRKQLKAEGVTNRGAVSKEKLAEVLNKIKQVDDNLDLMSPEVISPKKMGSVIRGLFEQQNKLTLLRFKTSNPIAITERIEGGEVNTGLYRHKINLQFEGDHRSVVAYLKSIEKTPWPIYWNGFDYQVRHDPKAIVNLQIETLSDGRGWLAL